MKFILATLLVLIMGTTALAHEPGSELREPFLKEFSTYPNPTQGNLTISFSALDASKSLTLKIYNLIGKELYTESFSPFTGIREVKFNLSQYPKGMYMIEISDGKNSRIKRVSRI